MYGQTYVDKAFKTIQVTFHQHVSYASVGVCFDFGPFCEYVTSIVKSLEGDRYARMSGYGKATVSRLLTSVHGIDERLSGYYRFFKAKPAHDDRVRRQLDPIGVGIGILAMYDVETLRSMVGRMQDRQNSLVTQMESLNTDTVRLAKNFKKLQGAVDMKNLEVSTSHFFKIEIAIQQVAVMAEQYFSGLSSLMDGKLNVDMVNAAVASEEFTKVKEAAFSQGLETVFQDFTHLYQLPASYVAVGGQISVVVDVQLIPTTEYGKLTLFRHDSLPFFLNGRLVRLSGESNLLAVSAHRDEFVEVASSALHGCLYTGTQF